jgi:hypothetical protein
MSKRKQAKHTKKTRRATPSTAPIEQQQQRAEPEAIEGANPEPEAAEHDVELLITTDGTIERVAPPVPDAAREPVADMAAPSHDAGAMVAPPDATTGTGPRDAAAAPAAAPTGADTPDLGALRVKVEESKAKLEETEAAAKAVEENARAAVATAKARYLEALRPYRDACKIQGRECEYEAGRTRAANLSEVVRFEVTLDGEQVRIAIKGKPETEERIPIEEVRASITKVAYAYTDKFIGPRDVVGNKGGSLSNRLRAALAAGTGDVGAES